MEILKEILLIMATTIIAICAFGGGCIIWSLIASLIKPNIAIFEVMFYISTFIPIPFCWWIAPKMTEKFYKNC